MLYKSLKDKIKNHSNMFRIVCDPSSGSTELYLTEITRSWELPAHRTVHTHTHHRFKITLPNTDEAHDKISVNHFE